MVKYILNNFFLILISFFLGISLIYSSIIIFNDVKYYNEYVEGLIVDTNSESTINPDVSSTIIFKYKIISNRGVFFSKSTQSFKLKDKVFCAVKNCNTVKILRVNDIKINNEYGVEDLMSILVFVFIIFYVILKRKKK